MFTDMVGYTALGQRNESLSLALVEEQRKLIRPALGRHDGREVKTMGDAFLVEFPNAIDAVRCAYDIQRAIKEFNLSLPLDRRIHLRIGVHVGEIVESDGDISGDAVNVASRIEPLAEDGGICLTQQVYDHVRNKLEFSFDSVGPRSLKNVDLPVQVYKVVMPWVSQNAKPPPTDKRRIAVLPLSNISHDQSDEYFAEGMTEELINALSHVQGLKVIARTSVARYKGNPKPVSEIGRELDVGSVMEGSVRKAGDRVRVTAQLIDVTSEEHLWSENYDRKFEDVFAIQSDVAEMVAEALKARLLDEDRRKLEAGSTTNPEAYDRYLLAKHGVLEGHPFEEIRLYKKAIELDPNFALAYAALGNLYIYSSGDYIPIKEAFEDARKYIDKASSLDSELPAVWNARANFALQAEWDVQKAILGYKRAIELNPNESDAYGGASFVSSVLGRHDESLQFALKERALNPLPGFPSAYLCTAYALANRSDDAERELNRMSELYPADQHRRWVLLWFSETHGLIGKSKEGAKEMDQIRLEVSALHGKGVKGWIAGLAPGWFALSSFNYAATGETDKIKAIIGEAEEASKMEYVNSSTRGFLCLASGDIGGALGWFEKCIEERDPGLLTYSAHYLRLMKQAPWLYDSVISDQRFVSLLQRAGVQPNL